MDLIKKIHSDVLRLRIHPSANKDQQHGFQTGIHAAAAAVSLYHCPNITTPSAEVLAKTFYELSGCKVETGVAEELINALRANGYILSKEG